MNIRCTNCGHAFSDLLDIQKQGGIVRQVGLMLQAKCRFCGHRFPVNRYWKQTKVVTATVGSDEDGGLYAN